MKKLTISIIVILVLIIVFFIWRNSKAETKRNEEKFSINQSIAVLPFINMSNDPTQ